MFIMDWSIKKKTTLSINYEWFYSLDNLLANLFIKYQFEFRLWFENLKLVWWLKVLIDGLEKSKKWNWEKMGHCKIYLLCLHKTVNISPMINEKNSSYKSCRGNNSLFWSTTIHQTVWEALTNQNCYLNLNFCNTVLENIGDFGWTLEFLFT